ncbi:putative hydrogenase nickel incorporation protein HypA 1 [uncultured Desulfovibrio sp.]|uniref:Hydrogenase maturation factor HypA n=3 Tax=Desulfovibrio TaxID=872 RepID=A0A212L037_9BACT|nr:putative hydrogenase nickel incorporation protein HypA 1 [uncultured Desulfovibrio sp.]VZH32579.1 Hydrogenase maturation factor HypA [Desulfovibrio sp. 86]
MPSSLYLARGLRYCGRMHEMAIAQSLLKMSEEEISRQGCTRIEAVNVKYGALAGIVPESLQFCFETMIQGTPHEGARLELEELPLQLHCPFCGADFGGEGQEALIQPCPGCGEQFGHVVKQGRELYLNRLEAS